MILASVSLAVLAAFFAGSEGWGFETAARFVFFVCTSIAVSGVVLSIAAIGTRWSWRSLLRLFIAIIAVLFCLGIAASIFLGELASVAV